MNNAIDSSLHYLVEFLAEESHQIITSDNDYYLVDIQLNQNADSPREFFNITTISPRMSSPRFLNAWLRVHPPPSY